LHRTNFSGAKLFHTRILGADLSRSNLKIEQLVPADWEMGNFDFAQVAHLDLF
jgi:uncharacterized protein YjbI with pentapeptide repeats